MYLFTIVNPAVNSQIGNINVNEADSMVQLLLRNVLNAVMGLSGIYFFVNLLMGGFAYITAGGDKEGVQKATHRIRNALIGIAILLSSFVIIWIIEVLFGVSILSLNVPEL